MSVIRFSLEEAGRSLRRRRQAGVFAVVATLAAFLVLGCILWVTTNVARIADRWSAAAEMSVYLTDTATEGEREAVERALDQSGQVVSRQRVSPDDALRRFRRQFPDLAGAVEALGRNPLPASIEARLSDSASAASGGRLAGTLRALPGVADVRYDQVWLARVLGAARAVRVLASGVAAVLMLAAALIVGAVVRLALLDRRDEVEIMQLVGAPLAAIRGPFVLEGMLHGFIGAAGAMGLLALAHMAGREWAAGWTGGLVRPDELTFLSGTQVAAVIAAGLAVGCLGGVVAARAAR